MWLGDADAHDAIVEASGSDGAEARLAPAMVPTSDSEGDEAFEWRPLEWAWHGEGDDAREAEEMIDQAETFDGATRSDGAGDAPLLAPASDDAAPVQYEAGIDEGSSSIDVSDLAGARAVDDEGRAAAPSACCRGR